LPGRSRTKAEVRRQNAEGRSEDGHGGMMRTILAVAVMVVAVVGVLTLGGCDIAQAAAVSPAKISPQKNTTVYFGTHTFANAHYTDTLVWSSDRNFNDTANYTCAVIVSGVTTSGILTGKVLNDSAVIVASTEVTDSVDTYSYEVLLKKK